MTITLYNTVAEFIADCDKDCNSTWEGHDRSSRKAGRDDWSGAPSYEFAKNLAINGWEKGLKDIQSRLVFTKGGTTPHIVKDFCGHSPDVARFIAGLPDCMNRRVVSHSNRRPCLDIVFNASFGCTIQPDTIMNYGAAIASAIDSLEHEGYSVSLKIGAICKTYHTVVKRGYIIDLKHHGEPLDLGKLAYFIAHPSHLRRLGFAQWEMASDRDELGYSYGKISDMPPGMKGDIYFGKQDSDTLKPCRTKEGAFEFVKAIIQAAQPELLAA